MANNWSIPDRLEEEVRKRDKQCVYCCKKFENNHRNRATWEHINNKAKDVKDWNIALCCNSCNASKGAKELMTWFKSDYCVKNNINEKSVAGIIKNYIKLKNKNYV
jgi:hypothetical protein